MHLQSEFFFYGLSNTDYRHHHKSGHRFSQQAGATIKFKPKTRNEMSGPTPNLMNAALIEGLTKRKEKKNI